MRKQQKYLEAGKIVTTHGIKGELKLYHWADSPESLCRAKKLYLDVDGNTALKVVSARPHKNGVLYKFEGIDDIETARRYIDRVLYIDRKDIPLEKGAHFVVDLIGMAVYNYYTNESIGTVKDVINTGKQDLYLVQLNDTGEVRMVPAVPEFIHSISEPLNRMVIKPIKGLLSDED